MSKSNEIRLRCKDCEHVIETKAHDGYRYARCQFYGKPVSDITECSHRKVKGE